MDTFQDFFSNGWMLAGGGAAIAALTAGWQYVRSFFIQLSSIAFVSVTVNGREAEAMLLHFRRNYKPVVLGQRTYQGVLLHVRKLNRVQLIPLETLPETGKLFRNGFRFIWVSSTSDKNGGMERSRSGSSESKVLHLVFIRGMFKPDSLVIDATLEYNAQFLSPKETEGKRFHVVYVHGNSHMSRYMSEMESVLSGDMKQKDPLRECWKHRVLHWKLSDLGERTGGENVTIDNLALSPEAESLAEELKRWRDEEQWFYSRGIPWRYGMLLSGDPGTGKTALIRALAKDLDLPLYVFDLASLSNEELFAQWEAMLKEVPCMAVIEDIDAVFDGRTNRNAGKDFATLTFDALLNCLDGVKCSDGVVLAITTNDLEKVDSALGQPTGNGTDSTRPGRVDRILCLGALSDEGRLKVAKRILSDCPEKIEDTCSDGAGETPAQFVNRCTTLALTQRAEKNSA